MRLVVWEDKEGLKHGAYVRDGDSDDMAEYGVQVNPPNVVEEIDWRNVAQQIHNKLTEHHLFTWEDVQRKQQNVNINSIIQSVLKRNIIMLYRSQSRENKD